MGDERAADDRRAVKDAAEALREHVVRVPKAVRHRGARVRQRLMLAPAVHERRDEAREAETEHAPAVRHHAALRGGWRDGGGGRRDSRLRDVQVAVQARHDELAPPAPPQLEARARIFARQSLEQQGNAGEAAVELELDRRSARGANRSRELDLENLERDGHDARAPEALRDALVLPADVVREEHDFLRPAQQGWEHGALLPLVLPELHLAAQESRDGAQIVCRALEEREQRAVTLTRRDAEAAQQALVVAEPRGVCHQHLREAVERDDLYALPRRHVLRRHEAVVRLARAAASGASAAAASGGRGRARGGRGPPRGGRRGRLNVRRPLRPRVVLRRRPVRVPFDDNEKVGDEGGLRAAQRADRARRRRRAKQREQRGEPPVQRVSRCAARLAQAREQRRALRRGQLSVPPLHDPAPARPADVNRHDAPHAVVHAERARWHPAARSVVAPDVAVVHRPTRSASLQSRRSQDGNARGGVGERRGAACCGEHKRCVQSSVAVRLRPLVVDELRWLRVQRGAFDERRYHFQRGVRHGRAVALVLHHQADELINPHIIVLILAVAAPQHHRGEVETGDRVALPQVRPQDSLPRALLQPHLHAIRDPR